MLGHPMKILPSKVFIGNGNTVTKKGFCLSVSKQHFPIVVLFQTIALSKIEIKIKNVDK